MSFKEIAPLKLQSDIVEALDEGFMT